MAKLDADDRDRLGDAQYAFASQRKEPIENAAQVRNAIARFDQVEDVSDGDRDVAWNWIAAAAAIFGVEVSKKSWRDLGTGRAK